MFGKQMLYKEPLGHVWTYMQMATEATSCCTCWILSAFGGVKCFWALLKMYAKMHDLKLKTPIPTTRFTSECWLNLSETFPRVAILFHGWHPAKSTINSGISCCCTTSAWSFTPGRQILDPQRMESWPATSHWKPGMMETGQNLKHTWLVVWNIFYFPIYW